MASYMKQQRLSKNYGAELANGLTFGALMRYSSPPGLCVEAGSCSVNSNLRRIYGKGKEEELASCKHRYHTIVNVIQRLHTFRL